jgi:hypothetical protein
MKNSNGGQNINHGIGMLVHFYTHLDVVVIRINLPLQIINSWVLIQNPAPKYFFARYIPFPERP